MSDTKIESKNKFPFTRFLLQTNSITQDTISRLNLDQLNEDEVISLLTKNEIIPSNQLDKLYQSYNLTPFVFFGQSKFNPKESKDLPQTLAQKTGAVLLENNAINGCILAITNPLDFNVINSINRSLNTVCKIYCIHHDDIGKFHAKIYSNENEIKQLIESITSEIELTKSVTKNVVFSTEKESQVAQLIQLLVAEAVNSNCSDIHIEDINQKLSIRMRKDGILEKLIEPNGILTSYIFRTLKIMANLDSTEDFHPLDGRFSVTIQDKQINIRLSIMPLITGTSAVLRVLGQEANFSNMQNVIKNTEVIDTIQDYIRQDAGLLIVVGPTGSGKTTTLYNTILNIDSTAKKIITIEDPVEVVLKNINQIQVRTEFNFDFPDALRSVLRQDPDVILIGEIRDATTAKIAMRAAITGHMVLATIHADNVETTIPRLLDLGVDDFYLESALKLIISQRLLREVCSYCCMEDKEFKRKINKLKPYLSTNINMNQLSGKFKQSIGCSACNHTGYQHRFPVFEYFNFSNIDFTVPYEHAIKHISQSLKSQLKEKTLLDNAYKSAISGKTTLDEVMRLIDKR